MKLAATKLRILSNSLDDRGWHFSSRAHSRGCTEVPVPRMIEVCSHSSRAAVGKVSGSHKHEASWATKPKNLFPPWWRRECLRQRQRHRGLRSESELVCWVSLSFSKAGIQCTKSWAPHLCPVLPAGCAFCSERLKQSCWAGGREGKKVGTLGQ